MINVSRLSCRYGIMARPRQRHRLSSMIFFVLFYLFYFPCSASAEILHLELGVANYGPKGHQTVDRFKVLDETLADLVAQYGKSGTIYLNDIDGGGLELAVSHAKDWLSERGLQDISIKPLPGDYTKIPLPSVKSAHLSNPGQMQVPMAKRPEHENEAIVFHLERIASHSESGLRISSYYRHPLPDHMGLLGKLARSSVFLETGQDGYAYRDPVLHDRKPQSSKLFILMPKERFCALMLEEPRVWGALAIKAGVRSFFGRALGRY